LGMDCKHRFAGLVPIIVKAMCIPEVGDFFERLDSRFAQIWR